MSRSGAGVAVASPIASAIQLCANASELPSAADTPARPAGRPKSGETAARCALIRPTAARVAASGAHATGIAQRRSQATRWREMLSDLTQFATTHGHTFVPYQHTTADGRLLGPWVQKQRKDYRNNRLDAQRTELLNAVPSWTWSSRNGHRPPSPSWEDMFAEFSRVIAENGHAGNQHCNGPMHRSLEHWIGLQRKAFRAETLNSDQIARLTALLGEGWAEPLQSSWDRMFAELERFAADNGHTRVARYDFTSDGRSLGDWVSHQRQFHHRNRLDPARAARLEALPGWDWGVQRKPRWEGMFAELQRFCADNGHARLAQGDVTSDGIRLGRWVHAQRRRYHREKLDPVRAARLEALPGWDWGVRRQPRWEDMFAALQRFAADNGHARVAQSHVTCDGIRLGDWVSKQRQLHRRDRLDPARAALLEALPGWAWGVGYQDGWEAMLAALQRFAADNGHARVAQSHVTSDGRRLGQWVSQQRQLHRDNRLDPDRAMRLEEVPGWLWDARVPA
jgi:hypothetical protein